MPDRSLTVAALPEAAAWQVYDPATSMLLWEADGCEIALPSEDAEYRIVVHEGHGKLAILDAVVEQGAARIMARRSSTAGAIRREALLRAIPKAFVYPVRSLWRNRKLIAALVRRDILARYRGSLGGALWTILNPLLLMLAYYFVFGVVLQARFAGDPSRSGFVLYFLAGMLPWLAFSEAAGRAPFVILEHRNFVKKLVFPLEILPPNLVISGLVTQVFALAVFVALLVAARGGVPWTALWLPAVVLVQLLFTLGLAWILATAGVFIRDLGQIMGFLLTLWFFLTPICYPETAIAPLRFNPIFILVRAYRAIFLEAAPPQGAPLAALGLASLVLALAGHAFFHKLRRSFADVI